MAYRFDLETAISRTMQKYGIERPTAAQWNFVLTKIHVPGIHRNATRINLDRLQILLHDYVLSCYLHDQYICLYGFCRLADVSRETLYGWCRGKSRKDDLKAQEIIRILKEERAISIQAGLNDAKRCLGALGILKHEYAWTQENISDFADANGLIQPSKQSVSERYKAIQKA